jgi:hypothetical protein
MKFEQGYVRCVRNEQECVCSVPDCCDTEQQSASQPGSVASGGDTLYNWPEYRSPGVLCCGHIPRRLDSSATLLSAPQTAHDGTGTVTAMVK